MKQQRERKSMAWRMLAWCGLWIGVVAALSRASRGEELSPPRVENVMDRDPLLTIPGWKQKFSPHLKPLWLMALQRPDAETRRLVADTFTIAAQRGMSELDDVVAPLLKVAREDQDPVVRRAAARALVACDARSTGEELMKLAQADGLLMAQIVEPALARWDVAAMRAAWRKRLEQPDIDRAYLWLALDGLSAVSDDESVPLLWKLVEDAQGAPEVRVAAARAAGSIRDQGAAELATRLPNSPSRPPFLGKLLAAKLLRRHRDEPSLALLQTLSKDDEPAVASAALQTLWKSDVSRARAIAPWAINSSDAKLRRLGAEILLEQGDVAAIDQLGGLLNDRNPGVRQLVAAHFISLARKDQMLQAAVIRQSVAMLGTDQWRGLEQAALIVGSLDHEPAADRLVELLPFPRGETAVAAAWSLRQLKVPTTYGAVLRHAQQVDATLAMAPAHSFPARQQSQLFQLFGEEKYRESEMLLRKYVPKNPMLDAEARAAACWALGYFYEDQPENDLVDRFAERLADNNATPPEVGYVRLMSAVALGRMKAQRRLDVLREFQKIDGPYTNIGLACGWGIERITGEKMAPAPIREEGVSGWFLEPFGEQFNTPPSEAEKYLRMNAQ